MDPSLAVGRSRILLFFGTIGVVLGVFLDSSSVAWGCLAVVSAAFALNAAGKARHYHTLPITDGRRRRLLASWILLSVTVLALFAVFLVSRFGGETAFFWPLTIATIGFALVHRGFQREYLDGLDAGAE